jgi:hypothetical protein
LIQDGANVIAEILQRFVPGHLLKFPTLISAPGMQYAVGMIRDLQKLRPFRTDKSLADGMFTIRADMPQFSGRIGFDQ